MLSVAEIDKTNVVAGPVVRGDRRRDPVLMGVKLLWSPAPVCGDWADYVTAFLWGWGCTRLQAPTMGQFNLGTMLGRWSVSGGGNALGWSSTAAIWRSR